MYHEGQVQARDEVGVGGGERNDKKNTQQPSKATYFSIFVTVMLFNDSEFLAGTPAGTTSIDVTAGDVGGGGGGGGRGGGGSGGGGAITPPAR